MIYEYGEDWMDQYTLLNATEAVKTISIFGGNKVTKSWCDFCTHPFISLYSPALYILHSNMLTTRAQPKYCIWGDLLKPGMIVRVNYLYANLTAPGISSALHNEPGTLVRVLKVTNLKDWIKNLNIINYISNTNIEPYIVITELRQPRGAFLTDVQRNYKDFFNKIPGAPFAIEKTYVLSKATKEEREYYYKTTNQNGTHTESN